ncbi:MAG: hypothetical protein FJX29_13510 [Alphaproteobacteria bacterium]|nr:hypothetical protein [Alphaproteobacteria bacterium]
MGDLDKGAQGASDFSAWIHAMLAGNRAGDIPDEVLQQVMTAAVKAYAAKVEKEERDFDPFDKRIVSATEGVTAACAMIRAVDLNMFDVALWFNRPGHVRA